MTDEQVERLAGIMFAVGVMTATKGIEAATNTANTLIANTDRLTWESRQLAVLARQAFEREEERRIVTRSIPPDVAT